MHRSRPFVLTASAAVVLLAGLGAGRVLTTQSASSHRAPVRAAVSETTTTLPTTTTAPAVTSTSAAVLAVPTTAAAPRPTTTIAPKVVCRWSARIVSGGIPESANATSFADQFVVTITNSSWAGQPVTRNLAYTMPARSRGGVSPSVIDVVARTVTANTDGTATFVIPIGPESQGGLVSVLTEKRVSHRDARDVCDWHPFTIDYNGPEGLAGGLAASGATPRPV